MRRWIGAALLCGAPAAAQTVDATAATAPASEAVRLSIGVDQWHEAVSDFPIDEDGREYGAGVGMTRLRAGATWPLHARLTLRAEADLFADRVYGDVSDVGTDRVDRAVREGERFEEGPVVPRALVLDWRTPIGLLRVGHQASHWGLGIVANAGTRDRRLFGDAWRGSIVERALFATSPAQAFGAAPESWLGRATLAVAGDLVYADETARLLDDDVATQLVLSAFVRPREWTEPGDGARHDLSGGLYVVRRHQEYADGDALDVWVFDGHLRYVQTWNRTNSMRYELEAAWIDGTTDRVTTDRAPTGVDVQSMGVAFEMGWSWQLFGLPMGVTGLAGTASGDADPDDGKQQRFTFHDSYDVGLVLFDHIVPPLQRRAVERLDDPRRAKDAPDGHEALAQRGGVSGATYGGLRLAAGPWRGFDGGVQVLSASTSAPFLDPYRTFAAGGDPTNPFGGPGEGNLGTELDFVARYTLADAGFRGLSPSFRLTYGVFFPGEVLRGPDGDLGTVHMIQARLSIDYDLNGGT